MSVEDEVRRLSGTNHQRIFRNAHDLQTELDKFKTARRQIGQVLSSITSMPLRYSQDGGGDSYNENSQDCYFPTKMEAMFSRSKRMSKSVYQPRELRSILENKDIVALGKAKINKPFSRASPKRPFTTLATHTTTHGGDMPSPPRLRNEIAKETRQIYGSTHSSTTAIAEEVKQIVPVPMRADSISRVLTPESVFMGPTFGGKDMASLSQPPVSRAPPTPNTQPRGLSSSLEAGERSVLLKPSGPPVAELFTFREQERRSPPSMRQKLASPRNQLNFKNYQQMRVFFEQKRKPQFREAIKKALGGALDATAKGGEEGRGGAARKRPPSKQNFVHFYNQNNREQYYETLKAQKATASLAQQHRLLGAEKSQHQRDSSSKRSPTNKEQPRAQTTDFSLRQASEAFNFCETRKGFYLQSKATHIVNTSDFMRKTATKFAPSPPTKKRVPKALVSFYLPTEQCREVKELIRISPKHNTRAMPIAGSSTLYSGCYAHSKTQTESMDDDQSKILLGSIDSNPSRTKKAVPGGPIQVKVASHAVTPEIAMMRNKTGSVDGEGSKGLCEEARAEYGRIAAAATPMRRKKKVMKKIRIPLTTEQGSENASPGRDSILTSFDKRNSVDTSSFPPSPVKRCEMPDGSKGEALEPVIEKVPAMLLSLGKSVKELQQIQARQAQAAEERSNSPQGYFSKRSSIISKETPSVTPEISPRTGGGPPSVTTPLISAKVTTTIEGIRTTDHSPVHTLDDTRRTKRLSVETQLGEGEEDEEVELLQDVPTIGPLRYGYVQKKRSNLSVMQLTERVERRLSQT